jgi:photosynthesis system II assembly factor YCF48-like protein
VSRQRPGRGRQRSSGRRRDRMVFAAALLVAVPVLVWAGVRLAGRDRTASVLPAGDPGIAHVHGLGLNPVDDSLWVATHYGTFRIGPDKNVARIGGSYQDTMGFTVAGTGRLLGSGHPDLQAMRQGQPTRLGLIESTDGGATWRPLSLSGEVDFHALSFSHDRVYGWDASSGRFMVSADGRSWDVRSALPLAGFAVDPADPEHVVGAGSNGVIDSTDGGRTWRPRPGPAVVTLSWEPSTGLIGADPDGGLHRSADGGASWSTAGRLPGAPEALLVTAKAWYAAAQENGATGIYRSADGGRNWDLYYRDTA